MTLSLTLTVQGIAAAADTSPVGIRPFSNVDFVYFVWEDECFSYTRHALTLLHFVDEHPRLLCLRHYSARTGDCILQPPSFWDIAIRTIYTNICLL
jgi:hypothetical protein